MRIALIDDEKILSEKIKKKLEAESYSVTLFPSFSSFFAHDLPDFDLYLIDLSLGDGSGFDIITWLRKERGIVAPILMISGHADNANIIYGLGIGADDYLTKPFAPEILLARVQAIARRPPHIIHAPHIFSYGEMIFDAKQKEMYKDGKIIPLSKQESMMLELFIPAAGHVISRERLIRSVWGGQSVIDVTDNTIYVTLFRLKKKLGDDFPLKTLYNEGYILEI